MPEAGWTVVSLILPEELTYERASPESGDNG